MWFEDNALFLNHTMLTPWATHSGESCFIAFLLQIMTNNSLHFVYNGTTSLGKAVQILQFYKIMCLYTCMSLSIIRTGSQHINYNASRRPLLNKFYLLELYYTRIPVLVERSSKFQWNLNLQNILACILLNFHNITLTPFHLNTENASEKQCTYP